LRAWLGLQGGDAGVDRGVRSRDRVLEMFETYRGNAMVGVPTMLIAMLEHPLLAEGDVSLHR